MKIYLVGGAVRDKLLAHPIKERDWVVVGATPEEMIKQGFRQVGKEFPVFLHPKTNEEYALARVERKILPGYKGFTFDTSPEVTLAADLQRRDLTINAMAMDQNDNLIDPYHGKQDLEQRLLRHVSSAFAEDPVRILRVGRFLARYAYLGFKVAPETIKLMQHMVKAGEVDALVAERVWKELERSLRERNPELFFTTLEACGALSKLFPGLSIQGKGIQALQAAVAITHDAVVRFAALLHHLPDAKKTITAFCHRYRVPNEYKALALLTAQHYAEAIQLSLPVPEQPVLEQLKLMTSVHAERLLTLFSTLDIFRREQRFRQFLTTCQAIAQAHGSHFDSELLRVCAASAKSINVQAFVAQGLEGMALAQKLYEERLQRIKHTLSKPNGLL